LLRSQLGQAVQRQREAFAQAHTGEAGEQEGVGKEVVGPAEFLLQLLILVGVQRPGEIVWLRREVLPMNQTRLEGVTVGSQIIPQTAPAKEVKDASARV
jgi:hypothetical protein